MVAECSCRFGCRICVADAILEEPFESVVPLAKGIDAIELCISGELGAYAGGLQVYQAAAAEDDCRAVEVRTANTADTAEISDTQSFAWMRTNRVSGKANIISGMFSIISGRVNVVSGSNGVVTRIDRGVSR